MWLSLNFSSVEEVAPGVTRKYRLSGPVEISGPVIAANIDINPWSATNEISVGSTDPVPVVVYSSSTVNGDSVDLDTSKIDPATLSFGPGRAAALGMPSPADFNADYNTDAALTFATDETGILCGDTSVTLRGETYSGEPFEGTDSITTVDCDSGCHP